METRSLPSLDGRSKSHARSALHGAGGRGNDCELYNSSNSRGFEASASEASERASYGDGDIGRGIVYMRRRSTPVRCYYY